jgi:hypothetical protein
MILSVELGCFVIVAARRQPIKRANILFHGTDIVVSPAVPLASGRRGT